MPPIALPSRSGVDGLDHFELREDVRGHRVERDTARVALGRADDLAVDRDVAERRVDAADRDVAPFALVGGHGDARRRAPAFRRRSGRAACRRRPPSPTP